MALNHSQDSAASFNYSFQPLGRNTTNTPGSSLSAGSVVITTATLVFNVGVLLILLKEKDLRTPFTVYIVALLASNVVYVGVQTPMNIVNAQIGHFNACTLSIYCNYVVVAVTVHTHVLISINRAWALFFPVSYRNRHTSRMAWLLCLLMILYVHLLLIPGIIMDALYYRKPSKTVCFINGQAQFGWHMFVTVWVFDVSKLFVPLFYPFLLWKYLHQRTVLMVDSRSKPEEAAPRTTQKKKKKISRSFILLTLFTAGAVVCWMPGVVYYFLVIYIPENDLAGLSNARYALYPLLALADPVFFYITNLHGRISDRIRKGIVRKIRVGNNQRAVQ